MMQSPDSAFQRHCRSRERRGGIMTHAAAMWQDQSHHGSAVRTGPIFEGHLQHEPPIRDARGDGDLN